MAKKAELKTRPTEASVEDYLDAISDEQQRDDARKITKWMATATKEKPKMWGGSIVGFGSQHMKYASGRELDWLVIGFSARKGKLSLYLHGCVGAVEQDNLFSQLGKYKTGVGCLYIKQLSDIDEAVLKKIIKNAAMRAK